MGFMAGPRSRKFLDPHVPDPPVQGPESLGPIKAAGPAGPLPAPALLAAAKQACVCRRMYMDMCIAYNSAFIIECNIACSIVYNMACNITYNIAANYLVSECQGQQDTNCEPLNHYLA